MNPLPDGWSTRRPTLDDVSEILELAHASDIAAVGEPDFTVDEIREALTGPNTDPARDGWLVHDRDGGLVAWAFLDNPSAGPREFVEVYVWPQRGEPAQPALLELLLGRAAERTKAFGHDEASVRAGAIPTEKQWISVLTEAGFVFLKQHARMAMSLAGVSADAPEPAAGVTVRPVDVADEAELRRFHATIEEAFADTDHQSADFATWQGRLATESSVSFDEWFVGEVDGEWAGVLQSSDATREEGEGWIRFLAVLRPYRRRGVGEALLRRAFAAYAGKGLTQAGLGVDLANPTEAARLYLAVGMTPKYQADIYERPL